MRCAKSATSKIEHVKNHQPAPGWLRRGFFVQGRPVEGTAGRLRRLAASSSPNGLWLGRAEVAGCWHEAVALLLHPPPLTRSGRRQSARRVGAMHAVLVRPCSHASSSGRCVRYCTMRSAGRGAGGAAPCFATVCYALLRAAYPVFTLCNPWSNNRVRLHNRQRIVLAASFMTLQLMD